MGMKEEIFSIATALGYEGATPTSKTKAVHAVAEAVESGGGGGGNAGYDVTKVWAVPEQTVTSAESADFGYLMSVEATVDVKQMSEIGAAVYITVDGVSELVARLGAQSQGGAYMMYMAMSQNFGVMTMYDGEASQGTVAAVFSDAEPTSHTVSCYYESVTTTPEFDAAVEKSVKNTEDTVTLTLIHGEEDTVTCDKPSSKFINDDPRKLDWRLVDDGTFYTISFVTLNDDDITQGFNVDFIAQAVIQETDHDELGILSCKVAASFGSTIGDDGYPEVTWSVDSSTSDRITLGDDDGNLYEVTITSDYGDSPWTLDKSVSDIYNAYDSGKRVVFRSGVYDQSPIYLEGVTSVSRPSFSVTEFVFEKVFVNSANNQLINYKYNVSTVNNTPTMTLTQTAYQLTPAS